MTPPVRPVITIDVAAFGFLSAWPQIRAHACTEPSECVPHGIPLELAIQALELTLQQLRQLYIQATSSGCGYESEGSARHAAMRRDV